MITSIENKETYALYIHFPWCESICPYCDFHRYKGHSLQLEKQWKARIIKDILHAKERYCLGDHQLVSVFIGGGTPSLASAQSLHEILAAVHHNLMPTKTSLEQIEVTMEANPNSVEAKKFSHFRKAGVNRLSIGAQSFNNDMLQLLGRKHDGQQGLLAFHSARQAGFENINIDLMYGLPFQSIGQAVADIEKMQELNPEHLSYYQLTIEQNTKFYKDSKIQSNLPSDDMIAELEQEIHPMVVSGGLQRYEVSAWSKPTKECIHNLQYWHFGNYLAVGPGASSKWSSFETTGKKQIRWNNYKTIPTWLESIDNTTARRQLSPTDIWFEVLLNGLRMCEGIDWPIDLTLANLSKTAETDKFNWYVDQGLLVVDSGKLKATASGFKFLDEILSSLLPD